MSIVIPFPGAIRALGETFTAEAFHAGIAQAECIGIKRAQIDALFVYDRQFSTYVIGLLGGAEAVKRRLGEVGLCRLIGSMKRDVR